MLLLVFFDAVVVLFDEGTDVLLMREMYSTGERDLFWSCVAGATLLLLVRFMSLYRDRFIDNRGKWDKWILCQLFRLWFLVEPKSGLKLLKRHCYKRIERDEHGTYTRARQLKQDLRNEMYMDFVMVIFEDIVEVIAQVLFVARQGGSITPLLAISFVATAAHILRQLLDVWFNYFSKEALALMADAVKKVEGAKELRHLNQTKTSAHAQSKLANCQVLEIEAVDYHVGWFEWLKSCGCGSAKFESLSKDPHTPRDFQEVTGMLGGRVAIAPPPPTKKKKKKKKKK